MQSKPNQTGYVIFDESDALLEANAAMFSEAGEPVDLPYGEGRAGVLARLLSNWQTFDGKPVKSTKTFLKSADARWAKAEAQPIEVETRDGRWKLLTSHPRPHGGTAFISADITRLKEAEIAHRQEAEIAHARGLLADAIESVSEGFALYDEAGKLVMCNRRYRDMNHEVADILKPGLAWVELMRVSAERGVYRDAVGREDEWVAERLKHGVEFITGYELELAGGDWHVVSVHPTELGGFVITRTDITERKQIEKAEREADEIVRQVLDTCPVPIQMSTIKEGTILYRNPAHFDLIGHKKTASEYFADPGMRPTYLAELFKNNMLNRYEEQMVNADGKPFPASISARLFEFQGQQVIVSVVFDETERIAAQNQLARANERLIDAIESLSEGFALYDKDDCLVMANERYRQMHAVTADVLQPGVNWFDFLRAAAERGQFPVEANNIDDWLAERAKDRNEYRQQEFQHRDGNWYLVKTNPIREGGFVVTRADVSERKRAEAAQLEADELVRKVLEACPVNIQMTQASDGKLLYRSPATKELLGEVTSAVDYYVNPEARELYVERLMRTGVVEDFETELRRADGETCWCSISSRLIDFHDEKVIVSHTYDLTDRIQMQEELERQRENLHQNEKLSALGELLAGVAHELNNPLSVVVGQSLLLQETATDKKTAARAEKIGNAAERCSRIVKTFLAMARQQPTRTSNVQLNDIIEAALEVAGYSIRSSDVDLSLKLTPDLPLVWGDPDQLSQVIINLLVNAEQALNDWHGRRKIKIISRYDKKYDKVVVKIADTGPGIPDEIVSRVFEPFFTTKDVGAGTGIGLSFCHRIVASHNGQIRVESGTGKGTAFFVSLPVSSRTSAEPAPDEAEAELPGGHSILVVDDEAEVGELIAEVLTRDGYKVVLARSGVEALQQLARASFSLVLSDLKMPDMDGRRLFDRVTDKFPQMADRLAFITGDTMSPGARSFLDGSGRPFLEKPIKPEELRKLVGTILGDAV